MFFFPKRLGENVEKIQVNMLLRWLSIHGGALVEFLPQVQESILQ